MKQNKDMFGSIVEAMLPSFSFLKLSTMRNLSRRIEYCKRTLGEPLGDGSSRIVFELDDDWVLKLALNPAGIAQNRVEIEDNECEKYSFFPKIKKELTDGMYQYIVCENILPFVDADGDNGIIDDDFMGMFGINFTTYQNFVETIVAKNVPNSSASIRLNDVTMQQISSKNPQLQEIAEYLSEKKIQCWVDWCRQVNLGFAERNNKMALVVLDYGATNDVMKTYYGFGDKGTFGSEGLSDIVNSEGGLYIKGGILMDEDNNPIDGGVKYNKTIVRKYNDYTIIKALKENSYSLFKGTKYITTFNSETGGFRFTTIKLFGKYETGGFFYNNTDKIACVYTPKLLILSTTDNTYKFDILGEGEIAMRGRTPFDYLGIKNISFSYGSDPLTVDYYNKSNNRLMYRKQDMQENIRDVFNDKLKKLNEIFKRNIDNNIE